MLKTTILWSLLGLLGGVAAQEPFWIVSHAPLLTTRLDPIVSPGGVSGHTHTIVGGSAFAPLYEYDNLMKSKCTTANLDIDKSNYWVPQLYRKSKDGTLTIAPLSYANTYYQTRRTGKEKVYEFPPGFRMLAGSATRTTLDKSDPTNDAIRYVCLGRSGPETHEFPTQNCPHGLRAQAYFPHCWDGVNAWLEGSKHVAYGEGNFDGGGKCPETHPYRIQGLFFEFIFKDDYEYEEGARVWANGDTVGYSLHADFTNGWPVGTFKEIFDHGAQCSVGFSLEKCPPLAPHMSKAGGSCAPEGLRVDEDIGFNGGLTKLPGNNPIYGRGAQQSKDADYKESAKFVPITPALPENWNNVGCIGEVNGRALKGASLTSDDTLTPSKCMKFCADKGFKLAGMEYAKECYCGDELSNGATETSIGIEKCNLNCPGLEFSKGFCGGGRAISLYKWTGSGSPTVVDTKAQTIDPAPVRLAQVKATELRANHAKEDPDYPAGNVVTTIGGGGNAAPTQTGSATSTSSSLSKSAATSTSTSGKGNTTTLSASITSTGKVLIGVPTTSLTSKTSTSTSKSSTPSDGSCRRSRKCNQSGVEEQACVRTEDGQTVCGQLV